MIICLLGESNLIIHHRDDLALFAHYYTFLDAYKTHALHVAYSTLSLALNK